MKTKFVKVLGVVLVALFMISCGGKPEGSSQNSNNETDTISQEVAKDPVASEIEALNQAAAQEVVEMAEEYDAEDYEKSLKAAKEATEMAKEAAKMAKEYDADDYEKSLKAAEKALEMQEELLDMMDDLDDLDW